jgi:endonuclease YncB( thermonuclease family)
MSIVAAGLVFLCTPTFVADGDGPVWCAEGPRIRLAGIAARELDGTCRRGHPCPSAGPIAARDALVELLGGSRGEVHMRGASITHIRVRAAPMRCLSTGSARGVRTGAFCTLADGLNLSCAMLATGTVARWDSYWRSGPRCSR